MRIAVFEIVIFVSISKSCLFSLPGPKLIEWFYEAVNGNVRL